MLENIEQAIFGAWALVVGAAAWVVKRAVSLMTETVTGRIQRLENKVDAGILPRADERLTYLEHRVEHIESVTDDTNERMKRIEGRISK